MVNGYLYEGLVKMESGSPAPALATSWIISEDGLDYIFNLRPGVVFQDGSPLNADAVIANFNRWFDQKDALRGAGAYTEIGRASCRERGDVLVVAVGLKKRSCRST